jgi:hypothetical protein
MKCSYLPAHEDGTDYSETMEFKLQMPGNNPEENIRQLEDCLRRKQCEICVELSTTNLFLVLSDSSFRNA